MGEIAEAILNGDFDEITGEYLGEGEGFPCSLHYNKPKSKRNKGVRGVMIYLRRNNLCPVSKSDVMYKIFNEIIHDYVNNELKLPNKKISSCCNEIQKDFHKFANFVHRNYISKKKT